MIHRNRGQAFEHLINISNQMYKNARIAVMNKRPTPIKVLKTDKFGKIKESCWEAKSTVDYDGVYRGYAVCFEAKSVDVETRFDLKNIAAHQIDYLELAEKMGAICFFLIEFRKEKTIFLAPFSFIKEYVAAANAGGSKSIPRAVFNDRAYLVKSTNRALVDYIQCIDENILVG
ncbi:recombinase RecU [Bacillus manliponensis]|uniref:Holliday junction resolvase RecU n=1 Tax=Bacillus manliponensis TaxID=574376 RepID=A0A073JSJ9_9BACI|nr:Holliday junction resolvase RecU [Bacillus manliponensis]KEK17232.1 recombinase RecU [Bacillus manliponensis]